MPHAATRQGTRAPFKRHSDFSLGKLAWCHSVIDFLPLLLLCGAILKRFYQITTKRRRKRTSVEYCVKYSGDAILCAVVGFCFRLISNQSHPFSTTVSFVTVFATRRKDCSIPKSVNSSVHLGSIDAENLTSQLGLKGTQPRDATAPS
jgi:hypothetical protein